MNREEFTTLVKGEQEQLRRFLLALCCGNKSIADDIVQESLIKPYIFSSGNYNRGNFTAWIYKIAYRTFLDHMKCHKVYQSLDSAYSVEDNTMPADINFHYLELYNALDALPAKERTSLLLFYIKGYSIK